MIIIIIYYGSLLAACDIMNLGSRCGLRTGQWVSVFVAKLDSQFRPTAFCLLFLRLPVGRTNGQPKERFARSQLRARLLHSELLVFLPLLYYDARSPLFPLSLSLSHFVSLALESALSLSLSFRALLVACTLLSSPPFLLCVGALIPIIFRGRINFVSFVFYCLFGLFSFLFWFWFCFFCGREGEEILERDLILGGGEVIVVLREGVYEDVVEGGRRSVCVYCVYLFFWEGCGGGCCCGFSSTLVLLGTYDDD